MCTLHIYHTYLYLYIYIYHTYIYIYQGKTCSVAAQAGIDGIMMNHVFVCWTIRPGLLVARLGPSSRKSKTLRAMPAGPAAPKISRNIPAGYVQTELLNIWPSWNEWINTHWKLWLKPVTNYRRAMMLIPLTEATSFQLCLPWVLDLRHHCRPTCEATNGQRPDEALADSCTAKSFRSSDSYVTGVGVSQEVRHVFWIRL